MSKDVSSEYLPHATVDDLQAFFRPLDDDEKAKASKWLEYASLKIDARFKEYGKDLPTDETGLLLLRNTTCAMVTRALKGEESGGFKNISTTVGEFSESFSPFNPEGDIFIKEDELRDLGLVGGQFLSVEIGADNE